MKWRFLFVALLTLSQLSSPVFARDEKVILSDIRIGSHPDAIRIVLDLSGPVSYSDLPAVNDSSLELNLPDTVTRGDPFEIPAGFPSLMAISAVDSDDGALNVRINWQGNYRPDVFSLAPYQDRGYRLVIDLKPEQPDSSRNKVIPEVGSSQPGRVAAISGKRHPTAPEHTSSGTSRSHGSREPGAMSVAFGGTWEQQWAVETDTGDSQMFQALIEPRVDMAFSGGTALTAIARIRLDSVGDLGPDVHKPDNYSSINGPWYNNSHAEFSLRELYVDARWAGAYWRIGKQQVVWGQADGIKVLDVVNPQSYREFILQDFDKSRIPLTMVNMQATVGKDFTLQLLWIPDTTYHELAEPGTPYYLTSPLLVPVAPEGITGRVERPETPDNPIGDSDFGGRLTGYVSGWDVSLNYLYHYQDYPVLYQYLELNPAGPVGVVTPEYERNQTIGGTLSTAFDDFTLRAELAYSTDTYHVSSDLVNRGIENTGEFGSVLGLDWQLSELDTLLSFQWFQSHLFDYQSSIRRGQNEQNLSVYLQKYFANETWQFNTLALYSIDNQDSLVQARLKYMWYSDLELWMGADVFSGDREGIFGQFREVDRVLLGFDMGF